MFATRSYHYRDPAAVILGLKELRKQGLTPRGLLFIALDPRGETYIAVPEELDGAAWWVCPIDDRRIAMIGALGPGRRASAR